MATELAVRLFEVEVAASNLAEAAVVRESCLDRPSTELVATDAPARGAIADLSLVSDELGWRRTVVPVMTRLRQPRVRQLREVTHRGRRVVPGPRGSARDRDRAT